MLADIVVNSRKELVRDSVSVAFLIVSNFLPLLGVFAFGWRVFDIVLLYWLENVIIGVFNVIKIVTCMPQQEQASAGTTDKQRASANAVTMQGGVHAIKLFLVPFFTFHYGLFCTVHGVFIIALLGDDQLGQEFPLWVALDMLKHPGFAIAAIGLIASHGVSLIKNYYMRGEYKKTHPIILLFSPYARIVILHIAILLSAFLTLAIGSPIWMLLLLVIGKTAVDLFIHLAAHSVANAESQST